MTCYSPLKAYRAHKNSNGKRPLVFNKKASATGEEVEVSCGQCIGCRLDRSKEWAIRCVHEMKYQQEIGKQSCFITLTYDDDHLPNPPSLHYPHYQKFMKRLRADIAPNKISFYMCGEYGDQNLRPHYHALIFGYDFPDRQLWQQGANPLYISEQLQGLWKFGFSTVGAATYESAAYVARYILKKQTGDLAEQSGRYNYFDDQLNRDVELVPEFTHMSLKPAIGKRWYEKYGSTDLYPHDFAALLGDKREHRVPSYYDRLLEKEEPELIELLKKRRSDKAKLRQEDQSPERLAVREKVQQLKQRKIERNL